MLELTNIQFRHLTSTNAVFFFSNVGLVMVLLLVGSVWSPHHLFGMSYSSTQKSVNIEGFRGEFGMEMCFSWKKCELTDSQIPVNACNHTNTTITHTKHFSFETKMNVISTPLIKEFDYTLIILINFQSKDGSFSNIFQ